jgi:outer membrane lipoprotein-sorting protein
VNLSEAFLGAPVRVEGHWTGYTDCSKTVQGMKFSTKDGATVNEMLFYMNGDETWTQMGYGAQRFAYKDKRRGSNKDEDSSLKGLTEDVLGMFDLTQVKEREIDGEPLYELSGPVREAFLDKKTRAIVNAMAGASILEKFNTMRKAVVRVSKIDLLLRSGEIMNEADQMLAQMNVSDLKADIEFAPETFVFTPGEGVKVTTIHDLLKEHNMEQKAKELEEIHEEDLQKKE